MESWPDSGPVSASDMSIKMLSSSLLQFIVARIIDHVAIPCLWMPVPLRSVAVAVIVRDVRSAIAN